MANQFQEADYKKYFDTLGKQKLSATEFVKKVQEDTKLLESQGYTLDQDLITKYFDPIAQAKLESIASSDDVTTATPQYTSLGSPALGDDVNTIDLNAIKDSSVRLGTLDETEGVTVDPSTYTAEPADSAEMPDGFNAEEYLALYPDVAQAGVDPLEHYLNFGKSEGRSPNQASFETNQLLAIENFKSALPENMKADYQFIVDNPERFTADGQANVQAIADYLKDKGFSFEEAIQLTGLPTDHPLFKEAQVAYGVSDEEVASLVEDGSLSSGGEPTEAALGSIVPGVPQVGEVNILDYLALQAGTPTLPVGTKLATQVKEITPTVTPEGGILELLSKISAEDETKLAKSGVTATATKVASQVEGTATVPGQVTVPKATDVTTDIVEASEFTEAGVPAEFVDPVTGKLKTEDNLATMAAKKSYTDIDTQAKAFTEAKQELSEVNKLATVTGQLALLQEQFADGEVPVWASGAFRTVNALMAQRGIGGSTMAAEAITNALMQSAIPIAQQDASFYQSVTMQNLANEQQVEMAKFNARTAAIFNDQAAINAARNLNTQEENALTRFFAELATNVSVTNAEMSNSMEQFNSTAKNQMAQFFEELGLTAETFNADQLNELSKFDAEQSNIISQFNASLQNQREQFNVNNQLAIDASNVGWRRDINTANTSAENAALQFDAQNLLGIQQTSLNNIWQHYDTILNYAYQAEQNSIDRAYQLMLTTMTQEFQKSVQEDSDLMSLVGSGIKSAAIIAASPSGRNWVSDLIT